MMNICGTKPHKSVHGKMSVSLLYMHLRLEAYLTECRTKARQAIENVGWR